MKESTPEEALTSPPSLSYPLPFSFASFSPTSERTVTMSNLRKESLLNAESVAALIFCPELKYISDFDPPSL